MTLRFEKAKYFQSTIESFKLIYLVDYYYRLWGEFFLSSTPQSQKQQRGWLPMLKGEVQTYKNLVSKNESNLKNFISDEDLLTHVIPLRKQGLTYKQIASELGISYSNLRKRLHKLRRKGLYRDPLFKKTKNTFNVHVTRKLQLVAIQCYPKPSNEIIIDLVKKRGMIHVGELHRKLSEMGYRISREGLRKKLAKLEKRGKILVKRNRGIAGNVIYYINNVNSPSFPLGKRLQGNVFVKLGNKVAISRVTRTLKVFNDGHIPFMFYTHNNSRREYGVLEFNTRLGFWFQGYSKKMDGKVVSKLEFNKPPTPDMARKFVRFCARSMLEFGLLRPEEIEAEVSAAFEDFTQRCVYVVSCP